MAGSVSDGVPSGRTSSREVMSRVQAIQTATAAKRSPKRSAGWLSGGISANRSAMPVWNGLVGPKAAPTAQEPTLMLTAVMAPNPRPRLSTRMIGMSATSSSCMFSSAPSVAKMRQSAITTSFGFRVRPTSDPTSRPSAPVASSSAKAPPTMRMVRMTSAPATMPLGTASTAAMMPTGAASSCL